MRTLEMFEKPRSSPRVLMHVVDAGISHVGNAKGKGEPCMAKFRCKKCGNESEWLHCDTATDAKKGIPCPVCDATKRAAIGSTA